MKVRSLAVMLAALLVPAAATAAPAAKPLAQARPAPTSTGAGMGGLSVGGFVGYETDDIGGFSLRLDGELPFRELAPQVKLSWVGSLGYSRLTESEGAFGIDVDTTVNIVKIVPAARFTFPINQQFDLFADGGLGLYYLSWEIEESDPFFGRTKIDDSELSLMMRIGGGAFYHVNDKTRIGAMLEFDPLFGDFDLTTFIVQVGAMFRL